MKIEFLDILYDKIKSENSLKKIFQHCFIYKCRDLRVYSLWQMNQDL